MSEIKIKESFERYHRELLGEEYKDFIQALLRPLRPCIRINTIKIEQKVLLERFEELGISWEKVPWASFGYWLSIRRPGTLMEHALGYFYVQEAASMIPIEVLKPKPGHEFLDLAAAPGSKTTQAAQHMENRGLIIANDIDRERAQALASNLQRLGVSNTIITLMDGRFFHKTGLKFDLALVDAPCSGVGVIRRDYKPLEMWNLNMIRGLARLQRALLESAFLCLKPKGLVVYSTCTTTIEENELVVKALLEKHDDARLERIKLKKLRARKGMVEGVERALRIWPQDNDTQAFFVALIRRVEV